MPRSGALADVYAPLLSASADRFGITTPKRVAAWAAMIAEECEELTKMRESFNYRDPARLIKIFPRDFKDAIDAIEVHSRGTVAIANRVYANQNGNGDEASGDGFRYCGRGAAMITGKGNYRDCGNGLDLDLIAHPELLEMPQHSADSAGWFFQAHSVAPAADRGDIIAVTKIWNGGKIGLAERIEYYRCGVKAFCK